MGIPVLWKTKNVRPKNNSVVAVLTCHNKEHLPLSYEIHFGVVEYNNAGTSWRANICDMSGMGSWCPGEDGDFVAWTEWQNIPLPDFCKHNPHWGEKGNP